jgi:hypothetical protein
MAVVDRFEGRLGIRPHVLDEALVRGQAQQDRRARGPLGASDPAGGCRSAHGSVFIDTTGLRQEGAAAGGRNARHGEGPTKMTRNPLFPRGPLDSPGIQGASILSLAHPLGHGDRFLSRAGAEFAEDVLHVRPDGGRGHHERLGDVGVGALLGE